MKNTPMPLDLVFIGADGKVRDNPAWRTFLGSRRSGPDEPVRFVLELKRGTAEQGRHHAVATCCAIR